MQLQILNNKQNLLSLISCLDPRSIHKSRILLKFSESSGIVEAMIAGHPTLIQSVF